MNYFMAIKRTQVEIVSHLLLFERDQACLGVNRAEKNINASCSMRGISNKCVISCLLISELRKAIKIYFYYLML